MTIYSESSHGVLEASLDKAGGIVSLRFRFFNNVGVTFPHQDVKLCKTSASGFIEIGPLMYPALLVLEGVSVLV